MLQHATNKQLAMIIFHGRRATNNPSLQQQKREQYDITKYRKKRRFLIKIKNKYSNKKRRTKIEENKTLFI